MKFQDTSIHRLKVKKKVVRTHGHTNKPKAICPTNFFQSWGHKNWVFRSIHIFLIFAKNIDCGYSLEPPWRGGSNVYP